VGARRGQASFDWLKDRIKRPKVVVDLGAIEELKGIRSVGDGLEIGATTSLTEVARHPVVKQRYLVFWRRRRRMWPCADPQPGTLGGNLSQGLALAGTTAPAGLASAPVATSVTPTRPPA